MNSTKSKYNTHQYDADLRSHNMYYEITVDGRKIIIQLHLISLYY